MSDNKAKLIEQLQQLDFNELVETIHLALEPRNKRAVDYEAGLPDNELFLLSRVFYDATEEDVLTFFCGVGSSLELNNEVPGQSGSCNKCKSLLTSSCKRVTCPVCGIENIGLT